MVAVWWRDEEYDRRVWNRRNWRSWRNWRHWSDSTEMTHWVEEGSLLIFWQAVRQEKRNSSINDPQPASQQTRPQAIARGALCRIQIYCVWLENNGDTTSYPFGKLNREHKITHTTQSSSIISIMGACLSLKPLLYREYNKLQ